MIYLANSLLVSEDSPWDLQVRSIDLGWPRDCRQRRCSSPWAMKPWSLTLLGCSRRLSVCALGIIGIIGVVIHYPSLSIIILTFDAQLGGSWSPRNPEEQLPRLGLEHSMPLVCLFVNIYRPCTNSKLVRDLWTLQLLEGWDAHDLSDLPRFIQGYAQLMTFYGASLISSGWYRCLVLDMPVLFWLLTLGALRGANFQRPSAAPLIKQDEGGHLQYDLCIVAGLESLAPSLAIGFPAQTWGIKSAMLLLNVGRVWDNVSDGPWYLWK